MDALGIFPSFVFVAGVVKVQAPSQEQTASDPGHNKGPAVGVVSEPRKLRHAPHDEAVDRDNEDLEKGAAHGLGRCPAPSLSVKEAA